ncbi:hypothetical protein [Desulfomonile tiedjei]|uniref:Lipoprotein n=1 Tax=Desulfomonile tiedjei (strain ATCC 49306 / DSM 6799 / DCB-1) TaxID=706587 RepID=I4C911_DESTA|nr:hypothetical protein [Desulfomonile tiedjei]AFM26052.1 hypothetical protein Desti_3398 [Desulfomonile tiedjei DSM 6799]
MKRCVSVLAGLLVAVCLWGCGGAPSEIEKAVLSHYGKPDQDTKILSNDIKKSKEGSPSQDFKAKYNPQIVYCVACRTVSQFENSPKLDYVNHCIVVKNQSGALSIVDVSSITDSYGGDSFSFTSDRRKAKEVFNSLWNQTCSFPQYSNE